MIPTPAAATTECRLEPDSLHETLSRYEKLVSSGKCPHIGQAGPAGKTRIALYAVFDSNCHRYDSSTCDKIEGDWLWLIGETGRRRSTRPVFVRLRVKSGNAMRLKFLRDPDDPTSATDDLDLSDDPLCLFPFYSDRPDDHCDRSTVRVLRMPSHELRRVTLTVTAEIALESGNVQHQGTVLSAAVPPSSEEADAGIDATPEVAPSGATPARNVLAASRKKLRSGEQAKRIGWLHISDMHIYPPTDVATRFNQEKAFEKFLLALSSYRKRADAIKPQLIFVTGDLAYSGLETDYFGPPPPGGGPTVLELLEKVANVLELSTDAIQTVPGNHDACREAIRNSQDLAEAQLNIVRSPDEVTNLLYDPNREGERELLLGRFATYHRFVSKLREGEAPEQVADSIWRSRTYVVPGSDMTVGVVCLCSSLFSQSYWTAKMMGTASEKGKEEASGHLALCEKKVEELLTTVSESSLIIALAHHPMEFLSPAERKRVEPLLYKNADFVLLGHIHNSGYYIPPISGKAHTLQAGSLFLEREHHKNAFNFVEVDMATKKCRATVMHWHEDDWVVDHNAFQFPPEKKLIGYDFNESSGVLHFPLKI